MRKPADYTLYKYRYILSYFCIAVLLVAVLWIGVLYTPGGLREQEIKSVSQASMLSRQTLEPSMVVNLPYYLLQRLSIFVFGVSEFSIKLPSIALGTLTMLGIFMLIRRSYWQLRRIFYSKRKTVRPVLPLALLQYG